MRKIFFGLSSFSLLALVIAVATRVVASWLSWCGMFLDLGDSLDQAYTHVLLTFQHGNFATNLLHASWLSNHPILAYMLHYSFALIPILVIVFVIVTLAGLAAALTELVEIRRKD